MSLNKTPRANRVHIGIFGRRNAGKSSLINAITGQDIALVSDTPGTTTDPVYKSMELPGAGPVVFIDTPGIDDVGGLGQARAERALRILGSTDVAVLVVDPEHGLGVPEETLLSEVISKSIPVVTVVAKHDTWDCTSCLEGVRTKVEAVIRQSRASGSEGNAKAMRKGRTGDSKAASQPVVLGVSAVTGEGVRELTARLCQTIKDAFGDAEPAIVGDLLDPGDTVFLVVPLDLQAPKGRLILPQVQAIRDLLDHDCTAVMVKTGHLANALDNSKQPPALVITDSQVFEEVDAIVPAGIPLTSFSILFARYKGDLDELARGARALASLKPHDRVLIAEACTHHPIADDIGTVKVPRWLQEKVGGPLEFSWQRGADYPADLSEYKVIIHCGGCMLNRRAMLTRIEAAKAAGIPVTNYGMTIAYTKGILDRALEPFGL
ncbi:MAG: [FeFe] hydrogenase H-cluster maturation GTPase HydF [Bacillota bacterium]|jgi:small GTP-binding protein